jgi:hypothetical protein
MTSTTLPQELFDIAIRYLYDDHTASCACALVCRFWLHPARRNLFYSVRLQFNDWTVTDFLELLQSSPELGPYIQKVEWGLPMSPLDCPADSELAGLVVLRLAALSNEHGTTHSITIDMRRGHALYLLKVLNYAPSIVSHITWIRWGCRNGSNQWESSAAQSLASKLCSIKALTLAQWGSLSYPFVPAQPFQTIGGLFRPTWITTLNIENLVFTDRSQFMHFVNAFTALKHLSCKNIEWTESASDILSKGLPKAPLLRSLALGSSQPTVSAGVAQWLSDQPVTPHLVTIHVSNVIPNEMNNLVQRCAPSIINLTFSGKQLKSSLFTPVLTSSHVHSLCSPRIFA